MSLFSSRVPTWTLEIYILFGKLVLLGKIKSGKSSISPLFKKKKDESTNTRNLKGPKNQCFSLLIRKIGLIIAVP